MNESEERVAVKKKCLQRDSILPDHFVRNRVMHAATEIHTNYENSLQMNMNLN